MRPYKTLRLVDLEQLFSGSKGERDHMETLLAELGFRTTQGAEKLRPKVEKALATLTVKSRSQERWNGEQPVVSNCTSSATVSART